MTGAGWLSFLGLVNTAASAQDVVLTARRDDGTLWDLPANPKTVTLAPNAGWRGRVADLFGITDGASELRAGWIDVTLPAGFVASYIGYGNEATSSFALVSGVEESAASKLQVYSQVAEGGGFFTGLTVVNPSPDPAEIEFFTLLPDGSTVGRTSLTVPANGRVGRLYRELLPASLKQVGGWAYLRSDIEVVGAALFGGTNGFALASVPAESIAADFIPPAQVAAAITGAVRQDGVGVRDVTVSLTGPVTATTKTDGEGRFVFALFAAGCLPVDRIAAGGAGGAGGSDGGAVGRERDRPGFHRGRCGAVGGAGIEFHHTRFGVFRNAVAERHRAGDELQPGFGRRVQRFPAADDLRELGGVAGGRLFSPSQSGRRRPDNCDDTASWGWDLRGSGIPGDRLTRQPAD